MLPPLYAPHTGMHPACHLEFFLEVKKIVKDNKAAKHLATSYTIKSVIILLMIFSSVCGITSLI